MLLLHNHTKLRREITSMDKFRKTVLALALTASLGFTAQAHAQVTDGTGTNTTYGTGTTTGTAGTDPAATGTTPGAAGAADPAGTGAPGTTPGATGSRAYDRGTDATGRPHLLDRMNTGGNDARAAGAGNNGYRANAADNNGRGSNWGWLGLLGLLGLAGMRSRNNNGNTSYNQNK
jgi:MYXO-CTERM domain-containing protein